MRSARGDDENRRDRSPYFSNRSLQAMQDLESKRGRTLAGSPSPAAKAALHGQATKAVRQLPGVSHVQATMGRAGAAPAAQTHGHQHGAGPAAAPQRPADLIPEVRHTIAVSSGKGGVGKSTVAVN